MENSASTEYRPIYMIMPHWAMLFAVGGGIILLVIHVTQWFILHLTAASTRVFAVEALITGIIFDFIMRKKFNCKPMLFPKFKLPFLVFWIGLCIYVFIAMPF